MSLIGLARGLRQTSTEAERKMWAFLRGRRFSGFKFRRQQPLGPFIVDFLCKDRGLIIELDGGQHQDHVDADVKRTAFFESHGFRVLRFWNHEFLKEPLTVFECVLKEIQKRPPHPGPLPRGEGNPFLTHVNTHPMGQTRKPLPRGEGNPFLTHVNAHPMGQTRKPLPRGEGNPFLTHVNAHPMGQTRKPLPRGEGNPFLTPVNDRSVEQARKPLPRGEGKKTGVILGGGGV